MRTLVLGAGVSGIAAAKLAARLGHDVIVYDQHAAALDRLPPSGITRAVDQWDRSLATDSDLIVTSPGFSAGSPPLADSMAAPAPLVSEIEFAASHLDIPYAAVTGTNGKTTTTALAAEMLLASGKRAAAVGNIGAALSDSVGGPYDVLVIEASSFQLRHIDTFHPAAAVLLNIAPDHLDAHDSVEEYVAAKRRIFENQTGDDILVYDVDDPGAASAVAGAPSCLIPVSGTRRPEGGNGPVMASGDVMGLAVADEVHDVATDDPVHLVDLAAAATIARHLGADSGGISKTIAGFAPRPHRRWVVANRDGVQWINDSKATNPHAAVAAASSYSSVILIAGGLAKGLDLSPLSEVPNVKHVLAMGESTETLMGLFGSRATPVRSMKEAVSMAFTMADSGDTVLLAPACASFDMFADYKARGVAFEEAVAEVLA